MVVMSFEVKPGVFLCSGTESELDRAEIAWRTRTRILFRCSEAPLPYVSTSIATRYTSSDSGDVSFILHIILLLHDLRIPRLAPQNPSLPTHNPSLPRPTSPEPAKEEVLLNNDAPQTPPPPPLPPPLQHPPPRPKTHHQVPRRPAPLPQTPTPLPLRSSLTLQAIGLGSLRRRNDPIRQPDLVQKRAQVAALLAAQHPSEAALERRATTLCVCESAGAGAADDGQGRRAGRVFAGGQAGKDQGAGRRGVAVEVVGDADGAGEEDGEEGEEGVGAGGEGEEGE